jgi:hypothetical protein
MLRTKKPVIGKLHSPPYIACILQPVSEIFTNLRGTKTPESIAGHYIGPLRLLPGSGPVKKIKKPVIGKLHSPPHIACILQPVSEIFTNLRGTKTPESIAGHYIGVLASLPCSGPVKKIKPPVIGKLHSLPYIARILQPVSEIFTNL